jgi:hypothetical protein
MWFDISASLYVVDIAYKKTISNSLICQGIFYCNRRFFLKMFTKTPSRNYAIAGFPDGPGTAGRLATPHVNGDVDYVVYA